VVQARALHAIVTGRRRGLLGATAASLMVPRRALCLPLACILVCAQVESAYAQRPDLTATAEQLFEEGRALLAQNKLAEACPKLAESHRLDPAVGTLLNLGECYEKAGKTASAWATYIEADTLARRLGQLPRAQFAADRARLLGASLPRLSIDVSTTRDGAKVVPVTIKRDGEVIAEPAWRTFAPIDPGEHRIEASAPGFHPFARTISVAPGERAHIEVPALEAAAPAAKGSSPSPLRTLGVVLVGAGALTTGAGLFFGTRARSKNDDARSNFCNGVTCTSRGEALLSEADSAATWSTVLVSVGVTALVGGIVVFLAAPKGKTSSVASATGVTF
jgi:serine/threonine-protein kinase